MIPAERAVLDQDRSWLRDEIARARCEGAVGHGTFAAGVSLGFALVLRRLEHLRSGDDPGLSVFDLADAWQDFVREWHGV